MAESVPADLMYQISSVSRVTSLRELRAVHLAAPLQPPIVHLLFPARATSTAHVVSSPPHATLSLALITLQISDYPKLGSLPRASPSITPASADRRQNVNVCQECGGGHWRVFGCSREAAPEKCERAMYLADVPWLPGAEHRVMNKYRHPGIVWDGAEEFQDLVRGKQGCRSGIPRCHCMSAYLHFDGKPGPLSITCSFCPRTEYLENMDNSMLACDAYSALKIDVAHASP